MPLSTGSRLGPYEIVCVLGAGGMGEVYRARDGTLQRDVALKILPEVFALDPDRLARFRREAQLLASLNHPNIAAIYGFEESTSVHALVLELVEGSTLADRLAQGPIPFDEALPIARQIAEALEAAHEHGIIHRDLKPANIKLRPDGAVKVLDFGLAKLSEPVEVGRPTATSSPTITSPAVMTGVGILLGTAAYMSPEQAKGRTADKRSDVWSFGCVLYEMLTGRRAFDGEDMTEVLGAVVRLEPYWEALSPEVPPPVRTLLHRCLVKDRRMRIGNIAVARFVLEHEAAVTASGAAPTGPLWRRATTVVTGIVIGALLAGAATWFLTQPAPPSVVRTTIATAGSSALSVGGSARDVAITPDGSKVVYRGNNEILIRALDRLEPAVLTGGDAAAGLFISPDGEWVGFFDGLNQLKKVAVTGGPSVAISHVDGGGSRGATWAPDGTIIFATNLPATGLQRVSAAGGEPSVLTRADRGRGEADHIWPELLPGGKAVLFTATRTGGTINNADIAVLDLQTGLWKVLVRGGSHAHYVPTGHLVYGVAGTLRGVAFDVGRLEVVGTPAPVLTNVLTTAAGAADVDVAGNGSLVYVAAPSVGGRETIVSVDRQGHGTTLAGIPPDAYRDVRVSPDGGRLVLDNGADIFTYDFARAALTRLTTDPAQDRSPLWTPDSQRIIFSSNRAGYAQLFWRAADGTGRDERLLTRSEDVLNLRANSWSGDGKQLLFMEAQSDTEALIGQVAIARPSDVKMLLAGEFRQNDAAVSPDGRWIAYESNVDGRVEINVERYPELGRKQQISNAGRRPVWSRDGRELFFGSLDNRHMLAVPVQSATTLVVGRPHVLFELPMLPVVGSIRPYDVGRDGRFVIIRSGDADAGSAPPPSVILVENWFEELKRRVPRK